MVDVFNRELVLTSGSQALLPGDIFLEEAPINEELFVLSGVSNDFSSIKFTAGSSINQGSVIITGGPPNGIVQVINMFIKQVSSSLNLPVIKSNNITDASD